MFGALSAFISFVGFLIGAAIKQSKENQQRDPEYQAETAAADASYQNSYLANTQSQSAAYNNAMWSSNFINQVDTYKRLGLNPLLLAQNPSVSYTSAPAGPSNSVDSQPFDVSAITSTIPSILSSLPSSEEQELSKLKAEYQREQIQKLKQDRAQKEQLFGFELAKAEYTAENLKDQVEQNRATFQERIDYVKSRAYSQDLKNQLDEIARDTNDLLLQKEQIYSEYYEKFRNAELESITSGNKLNVAKTAESYSKSILNTSKIDEINSKISLNEAKVREIDSKLGSDTRNHVFQAVDDFIDPEKNPILNNLAKALIGTLDDKTNLSPIKF